MSKDMSYKQGTLGLINQLSSSISNSIIAKKNDGSVVINRTNPSETVSFFLTIKESDFDFDGDEISFYNFPEFYQLLSVFKEPIITQDNNKLVISKSNSKIKYILSDSDIITEGPKGLKIDIEPSCSFDLSEEEIKNFCKMIGLVTCDHANLNASDNELVITFGNDTHENTFEKVFKINDLKEEVNFNIPSEVFTIIPVGNYNVKIWKDGVVVLDYKSSDVSLKIMTAELEARS